MIENISVLELKRLNNINIINIIDIRSIQRYNNGHILNAKNIPLENLLINFKKYLKLNEKYYIYCQVGNQSKKICQILKNNGYNVVNVLGGYESWVLSE